MLLSCSRHWLYRQTCKYTVHNAPSTKQPHCVSVQASLVTSLLQQSRLFPSQNLASVRFPAKSPRSPSRTATILAARPRSDSAVTTHYSSPRTSQINAPSFVAKPRNASRPQTDRLLGTGGAAPFLLYFAVKLALDGAGSGARNKRRA